jgi:hypothetical protein
LGALLSVKGPWPISADLAEAKWRVAEAREARGHPRDGIRASERDQDQPRLVIDEGEVDRPVVLA